MKKEFIQAHINLTRATELYKTEYFVVSIRSTPNPRGGNPKEDPDLLYRINDFIINNKHVDVNYIEYCGPDDEGYENYAVLYCCFYRWYLNKLEEMQKGKK